eukprot:SAG11_NODE_716_length_7614_cov_63.924837_1_plen_153_part_00
MGRAAPQAYAGSEDWQLEAETRVRVLDKTTYGPDWWECLRPAGEKGFVPALQPHSLASEFDADDFGGILAGLRSGEWCAADVRELCDDCLGLFMPADTTDAERLHEACGFLRALLGMRKQPPLPSGAARKNLSTAVRWDLWLHAPRCAWCAT